MHGAVSGLQGNRKGAISLAFSPWSPSLKSLGWRAPGSTNKNDSCWYMEVPPQETNKQTKPAWVILGMNLKRDQKGTLFGTAVGRVLINCCKIYRRRVSGAPPGIAPTATQRKWPCRGVGGLNLQQYSCFFSVLVTKPQYCSYRFQTHTNSAELTKTECLMLRY